MAHSERYRTPQPNGGCRPHKMKTDRQLKTLSREWDRSPFFDADRIERIAEKIKLCPRKVYKWLWDRSKELGIGQVTF